MTLLWNDTFINEADLRISKDDRGYHFGDGVYEVIKVYGGSMFTEIEHIDRLYESADKIKLTIPYTKDVLQKMLYDLMEMNNLTDGHIYLQVTRGVVPRQHFFPDEGTEPMLLAYTKEAGRPLEQFKAGVKAKFVEDIRWLRCDIKSLNLLGNVLAKQEAHESGCYEAILHRGEKVTEGSSSNIFGIKDGVLYTHPADNFILNGITRRVVLQCCDEIGLTVIEEAPTKERLLDMDELFLSSTTSEITPIVEVDGHRIGSGSPGQWTEKLQATFEKKIPQKITI